MAQAGDAHYRLIKELRGVRDRLVGVIRESGMVEASEKVAAILAGEDVPKMTTEKSKT